MRWQKMLRWPRLGLMALGFLLATLLACGGMASEHLSSQPTASTKAVAQSAYSPAEAVQFAEAGPTLMYDPDTLAYWQGRYRTSSQRMLDEAIFPVLTPEERQALQGVQLKVPIETKFTGFYAQFPPPEVVLPTGALKFLDDLCIAYAWLWANGYSLETIEEYVAMLSYKPLSEFGGRYPTPFEALGIPANALDDPEVDSLSLRFFNSARAFILAHELAHIRFAHPGGQVVDEIQADDFALEVMARVHTLPMGAVLFFQGLAHLNPNRAQFVSDAEWESFLQNQNTHPLNGDRIYAIADFLASRRADFADPSDPNSATTVELAQLFGQEFCQLGDYLNDPDLQRCVGEMAANSDLSDLQPRRAGGTRLAC